VRMFANVRSRRIAASRVIPDARSAIWNPGANAQLYDPWIPDRPPAVWNDSACVSGNAREVQTAPAIVAQTSRRPSIARKSILHLRCALKLRLSLRWRAVGQCSPDATSDVIERDPPKRVSA
jgi:hypothetical protein